MAGSGPDSWTRLESCLAAATTGAASEEALGSLKLNADPLTTPLTQPLRSDSRTLEKTVKWLRVRLGHESDSVRAKSLRLLCEVLPAWRDQVALREPGLLPKIFSRGYSGAVVAAAQSVPVSTWLGELGVEGTAGQGLPGVHTLADILDRALPEAKLKEFLGSGAGMRIRKIMLKLHQTLAAERELAVGDVEPHSSPAAAEIAALTENTLVQSQSEETRSPSPRAPSLADLAIIVSGLSDGADVTKVRDHFKRFGELNFSLSLVRAPEWRIAYKEANSALFALYVSTQMKMSIQVHRHLPVTMHILKVDSQGALDHVRARLLKFIPLSRLPGPLEIQMRPFW